jgi:hypothetical protein
MSSTLVSYDLSPGPYVLSPGPYILSPGPIYTQSWSYMSSVLIHIYSVLVSYILSPGLYILSPGPIYTELWSDICVFSPGPIYPQFCFMYNRALAFCDLEPYQSHNQAMTLAHPDVTSTLRPACAHH